jgi:multidrug efflux pump subunit AcrB
MGFTLNRVSLFALIFSIGILVDDAIVVVENIHRHLPFPADGRKRSCSRLIPPRSTKWAGRPSSPRSP